MATEEELFQNIYSEDINADEILKEIEDRTEQIKNPIDDDDYDDELALDLSNTDDDEISENEGIQQKKARIKSESKEEHSNRLREARKQKMLIKKMIDKKDSEKSQNQTTALLNPENDNPFSRQVRNMVNQMNLPITDTEFNVIMGYMQKKIQENGESENRLEQLSIGYVGLSVINRLLGNLVSDMTKSKPDKKITTYTEIRRRMKYAYTMGRPRTLR